MLYRGKNLLSEILKNKKCFKLVCGAGNEDATEVEKLVALYSRAGCNVFDLSADLEVLVAAKRGLGHSIPQVEQSNFHFCISVGISGDPHVSKAFVDALRCVACKKCISVCPQDAISIVSEVCSIEKKRCIGCGKCAKKCLRDAIYFVSKTKNFKEVLPPLVKEGIDCIEFHALCEDESEVAAKWAEINSCFDGILGICVDRSKLGNEKLLKRIKKMIEGRKPFTTIIQADGVPMSGSDDDFKTTLQAIAMAEVFQNENLLAFLIVSGGTNSKSAQLAKQCGVHLDGVAIGSYARKIVKKYIDRDDFLTNTEIFEEALIVAQNLVKTSLVYLSDDM